MLNSFFRRTQRKNISMKKVSYILITCALVLPHTARSVLQPFKQKRALIKDGGKYEPALALAFGFATRAIFTELAKIIVGQGRQLFREQPLQRDFTKPDLLKIGEDLIEDVAAMSIAIALWVTSHILYKKIAGIKKVTEGGKLKQLLENIKGKSVPQLASKDIIRSKTFDLALANGVNAFRLFEGVLFLYYAIAKFYMLPTLRRYKETFPNKALQTITSEEEWNALQTKEVTQAFALSLILSYLSYTVSVITAGKITSNPFLFSFITFNMGMALMVLSRGFYFVLVDYFDYLNECYACQEFHEAGDAWGHALATAIPGFYLFIKF